MLRSLLGWIRRRFTGRTDSADSGESESSGTVWEFIPSWQYGGRHVESGGIARGEQEKALREIEYRADRIENGTPEQEAFDAPDTGHRDGR